MHGHADGSKGSIFWFSFPYRPEDSISVASFNRASANNAVSIFSVEKSRASSTASVPMSPMAAAVAAAHSLSTAQNMSMSAAYSVLRRNSLRNTVSSVKGSRHPSAELSTVNRPRLLSLRILVVDDSLPVLKIIHSALEKAGHQVYTAKNGARGLEEMRRLTGLSEEGGTGLDLVLMDLQVSFNNHIYQRILLMESTILLLDACDGWHGSDSSIPNH